MLLHRTLEVNACVYHEQGYRKKAISMEKSSVKKKQRKPPEKQRQIIKRIRFTAEELKQATENMHRLNIKDFSQFVRLKTLTVGAVLFKDRVSGKGGMREEEFLLLTAINRVGVNINQMAKSINENKVAGKPLAVEELKIQLTAFLEELKSINKAYCNEKD